MTGKGTLKKLMPEKALDSMTIWPYGSTSINMSCLKDCLFSSLLNLEKDSDFDLRIWKKKTWLNQPHRLQGGRYYWYLSRGYNSRPRGLFFQCHPTTTWILLRGLWKVLGEEFWRKWEEPKNEEAQQIDSLLQWSIWYAGWHLPNYFCGQIRKYGIAWYSLKF